MPVVTVTAAPKPQSYPIIIEAGLLGHAAEHLAPLAGRRALVVTDKNVYPLLADRLSAQLTAAGIAHRFLTLPAGETTKRPEMLMQVYDALLDAGVGRRDVLIALGGGVIGDLAGYAAATWMRGTRFVQVPTTLLAQVDSSVGGKVAVNHPGGKNLLGAFYQPELVLIDTDALTTLDARQFGAGLAEVVKYGCIADAALFDRLERCGSREALPPHLPEIITRCVEIKKDYVEEDPLDTGRRMELNFGHTLAHALENLLGYGALLHGEAVAIGMSEACRWGEALGVTPPGTGDRLRAMLTAYGIGTALPGGLSAEAVCRTIARDKKGDGVSVNAILLDRVGACRIRPMAPKALTALTFGDKP